MLPQFPSHPPRLPPHSLIQFQQRATRLLDRYHQDEDETAQRTVWLLSVVPGCPRHRQTKNRSVCRYCGEKNRQMIKTKCFYHLPTFIKSWEHCLTRQLTTMDFIPSLQNCEQFFILSMSCSFLEIRNRKTQKSLKETFNIFKKKYQSTLRFGRFPVFPVWCTSLNRYNIMLIDWAHICQL